MKKSSFALLVVLGGLCLFFSCSRRVETGFDSLEMVDRLVQDSLPSLQRLAGRAGGADGRIILIGDTEVLPSLSAQMLIEDSFDNVDARKFPDGLPDFAGETVSPVVDFSAAPYAGILSGEGGAKALKELAVRLSLAALDSAVNCKVLVICSPLMAEYGGDDVSDFFEKIGCNVPVIYSTDTTFSLSEACFRTMREKNLFTHNIALPAVKYYEVLRDADGSTLKLAEMPTVHSFGIETSLPAADTTVRDSTMAE